MKNSLIYIIVFLLIAFGSNAQTVISGVVTDPSNAPVPFASVYLSKTTVGVITDLKGVYTLRIPQEGKYELIASSLGYKTLSQIITAGGNDQKINITLSNYDIVLSEVIVKAKDRNRAQNYARFHKCFIGNTTNAQQCKIENPKDVIIYLDYKDSILKALSIKPLIITNKALGYKVIYELNEFNLYLKTGHLRFSGNHYFQAMEGNQRQLARWQRNRSIAYYGSRMHFLRAIYNKSVVQENFEMFEIEKDSLSKRWIHVKPLVENDIYTGFNPGSVTLYHRYPVTICFIDNHPELFRFINGYGPGKYYSTIIFSDSLQVYKNGYYPDLYGATWGGHMSKDRIAEMLPFDFVPKFIEKEKRDSIKETLVK